MVKMSGRYTENGVPIISPATLGTFAEDMTEYLGTAEKIDEKMVEWLDKIDNENGAYSAYIESIVDTFGLTFGTADPNPVLKRYLIYSLAGAYMLIDKQGEANRLEEELGN